MPLCNNVHRDKEEPQEMAWKHSCSAPLGEERGEGDRCSTIGRIWGHVEDSSGRKVFQCISKVSLITTQRFWLPSEFLSGLLLFVRSSYVMSILTVHMEMHLDYNLEDVCQILLHYQPPRPQDTSWCSLPNYPQMTSWTAWCIGYDQVAVLCQL